MRIGELARRTGVSRRSLRHYERHDLLHSRRDSNGWREYDETAVARVLTIAEMIGNGLTLDGVTQLAPCLDKNESSDCADPDLPLRTYRTRLAAVEERLTRLGRSRDRLARQVQVHRLDREPG